MSSQDSGAVTAACGDARGGAPHSHPRARAHAGTASRVTRLCHATLFCAITLRNSLLVSSELNTKQETGAERHIPLGRRRRPLPYATRLGADSERKEICGREKELKFATHIINDV